MTLKKLKYSFRFDYRCSVELLNLNIKDKNNMKYIFKTIDISSKTKMAV